MMSDERLCVICDQFFDLDSPDVQVVARSGGGHSKTTVLDSKGGVHILVSKKMSAKRKAAEVVTPAVTSETEASMTSKEEES
jgi:hypothetical protein